MNANKQSYRVLVVEDNPGDYLLIEDFLEEEMDISGITHARLFSEAKEILEKNEYGIDAILLDLTLPDKQGEDLIKEMVALALQTPLIVLTGFTDLHFAVKALSIGVSDYLLKDNLNSTVLYKSIIYNIERTKNLVRIKDSEQRYSDLFHLSPQPMWVFDLETLYFLDVNNAAVKLYGYSEDEFLQMTILQIRPESEIAKLEKSLEISRKLDERYVEGEHLHRKKSGDVFVVDIRSNIIVYKGRKAELVLATDITERYKHVRAIEDQNKALKEIAWTQSHTVRAPLARMMGLINTIREDSTSTEEKEIMLDYVIQSAEELDSIIQEIVNKSQTFDIKKL